MQFSIQGGKVLQSKLLTGIAYFLALCRAKSHYKIVGSNFPPIVLLTFSDFVHVY